MVNCRGRGSLGEGRVQGQHVPQEHQSLAEFPSWGPSGSVDMLTNCCKCHSATRIYEGLWYIYISLYIPSIIIIDDDDDDDDVFLTDTHTQNCGAKWCPL